MGGSGKKREEEEEEGLVWELGKVLTEPSHLDRGTHTHEQHRHRSTHTGKHTHRSINTHTDTLKKEHRDTQDRATHTAHKWSPTLLSVKNLFERSRVSSRAKALGFR